MNEPLSEFYKKYVEFAPIPLTKNKVSRALTAFGLKSVMKKIIREDKAGTTKQTTCIMIYDTSK